MSEAPERIWAEPGMPGYTDEPNELYTVEYVRADLIEETNRHFVEMADRIEELEAKLAKARKFVLRFAYQTRKIDHIGPEEWPLTELDLSAQRDRDIATARALDAEKLEQVLKELKSVLEDWG